MRGASRQDQACWLNPNEDFESVEEAVALLGGALVAADYASSSRLGARGKGVLDRAPDDGGAHRDEAEKIPRKAEASNQAASDSDFPHRQVHRPQHQQHQEEEQQQQRDQPQGAWGAHLSGRGADDDGRDVIQPSRDTLADVYMALTHPETTRVVAKLLLDRQSNRNRR